MNIIKTKSFELAVNSRGNENSERFALALPGRLDTKDYDCFNSHLEYLASKGFYAISFDPPGTWESPGGIELFTTTNYIKAVNELVEYFGNKPTLLISSFNISWNQQSCGYWNCGHYAIIRRSFTP